MDSSILRFLQHLGDQEGAADNTLIAYSTDLEQFQRVVLAHGDQPELLSALNRENVRHYAEWLGQQGYQPATVSRKMAAVRSFLGYIGAHAPMPARHLTALLNAPPSPQRKPLTLTKSELQRLLNAPKSRTTPGALRDAAILSVLYETGFRAHEMVTLQISDLDLERATLQRPGVPDSQLAVRDSIHDLTTYLKSGRPHFLKHLAERTLFLNQRGKGLSRQGLWLVVKRWANEAGLRSDLSPQTLRHTRAQNLLGQGYKRGEVQRLLGLSSPNALRIHRPSDDKEE